MNLWQSILLICLLPLFRSVMNCCEKHCAPFNKGTTWPKVFDVVSVLLGAWKLIMCWLTVKHQPTWRYLQTNFILFTSYILIAVGVFFITTCVCRFGVWDTFFRRSMTFGLPKSFKTQSPGSHPRSSPKRPTGSSPKKKAGSSSASVPRRYHDLYVVFNFGYFWAFLGYCLLWASQAGLLLMSFQAITYCYSFKDV